MRLLVVEDQKDLNEIIVRKLTNEHYSVDACYTGNDALDFIRCAEYDGIILDIMLPGITGIGVLREMRASGNNTPVLLLTAMGTVEDRVAGLDAGADDYLVKPFDFNELLARVRAIVRRGGERAGNVMTSGDLTLDSASRTVTRGGQEIKLTAKEFDVIEFLMRNPNRVKLSNHIWNYDYDGGSNVIDVYMYHLRRKIDRDFDEKKIQTVKGAGYMIK